MVCVTSNIPLRFPYCESRTAGTENSYATTIFQTSITGIFGEIDTSFFLFDSSLLFVSDGQQAKYCCTKVDRVSAFGAVDSGFIPSGGKSIALITTNQ